MLIAVVTVFVALAASRGDVEINLGDERFNAGHTERIVEAHRRGRRPARSCTRTSWAGTGNIFVQHTGDDPDEGWVAFGAFDPDDPTCLVRDRPRGEDPRQRVRPDVTYPLDGEGLRYYPTTRRGRPVIVDVNELTTSTTSGS